jgi:hypothetical protein
MESPRRYAASASGGVRGGRPYVVLDRLDLQGGKGMRRVSFHRTFDEARAEARRLNDAIASLVLHADDLAQQGSEALREHIRARHPGRKPYLEHAGIDALDGYHRERHAPSAEQYEAEHFGAVLDDPDEVVR